MTRGRGPRFHPPDPASVIDQETAPPHKHQPSPRQKVVDAETGGPRDGDDKGKDGPSGGNRLPRHKSGPYCPENVRVRAGSFRMNKKKAVILMAYP